ncbi:MAG: hypothetical protein HQM08_18670 [Candidatus Riflebacteria bacterium]|nr:hypothetical protein [Candidatus Riflebacteria bacterium]
MKILNLKDGRSVAVRTAEFADVDRIVDLYDKVYKGKYPLKDVTDANLVRKKIVDTNYFWPIAMLGDELIASCLFSVDPINKIGKVYAAVVRNDFRGQDIMHVVTKLGIERLTKTTRSCDVLYGTTRTVSLAPQVILEHLDFLPMGVFPNVRKVESFETHGLEIFFREESLKLRKQRPQLIPEIREFYKIARATLNLEPHEEITLPLSDPRNMGEPIKFEIIHDEEEVLRKFDYYQNKDLMEKIFFPFSEPNLLFVSEEKDAEIFVNLNETDGNGTILGYRIQNTDLRRVLMWFCEFASKENMRYVETLVSAFSPQMQRIAIDSKFLPCAYFPSAKMNENGTREDYIVFSRSFESLDFMDMKLGEINRRFLDAFMKCWYEMTVRCQPDLDGEDWRIA